MSFGNQSFILFCIVLMAVAVACECWLTFSFGI